MTSSELRFAVLLQLDGDVAVFASVTVARPSCNPVRRDVLSTSGVARRIRSTEEITRSVSSSEDPAGMM